MEFVLENYILRATADGKIERFWKGNIYTRKPDRWKELKGGKKGGGYLQIGLFLPSGRRDVLVHRLVYLAYNPDFDIWDTGKENIIDHRDGNPRNNKIENLQNITQQQNNFNRHTAKGYSFNKKSGKYEARIQVDGKNNYIGSYDTPEKARNAYLAKKATLHII
jgi:hypothetical protein